jgi:hypothetical protein
VRQPDDTACDRERAPAVRQVSDGASCGWEEEAEHGTVTDGHSGNF